MTREDRSHPRQFPRLLIAWLAVSALVAPLLRAQDVWADTACVESISAYQAAHRDSSIRKDSGEVTRNRMIRCVDQVDESKRLQAIRSLSGEASRLGGAFFEIPEYHDEGRLPTSDGVVLGPLAHIFASPYLGSFRRREQIAEQGKPGLLAAVVYVDLPAGDTMPDSYKALHLQAGLNCIWLHLPNASPGTAYRAFVSQTPTDRPCSRRAAMSPVLVVNESKETAYASDTFYPAVARFDVSGNNAAQPVMLVKCLAAMCEIGPTGSTRRTPRNLPPLNIPGQSRRRIKGWHDEQQLAHRLGTRWMATGVWAAIVPDVGAQNYDETDFTDTWRTVARIHVHDALPGNDKYSNWGLRQGTNILKLRFESGSGRWVMAVFHGNNAAYTKLWINVRRMIHYDAAVPPTARFRWTVADDGVWIPCGNACCKADGS